MFHGLELIDETSFNWRVRVRVTRSWPSIANNGIFLGFNYILLDAENYHVHAFVNPAEWNMFENIMAEGNVYEISNFATKPATGRLRPVSSRVSIILINSTIVQQSVHHSPNIPMHKFELVDVAQLYELTSSYTTDYSPPTAIDVIGVVENLEPVTIIHTNLGEKRFSRFQLYDGSNRVKVTIWDDTIAGLDALYNGNFEIPPILILATMRARQFCGSVQISSSAHSAIYINLDYEPVMSIRQRLIDQGYEADVNAP